MNAEDSLHVIHSNAEYNAMEGTVVSLPKPHLLIARARAELLTASFSEQYLLFRASVLQTFNFLSGSVQCKF